MLDVSLSGVKKYMDTTLVLKNITFMVNEGEKAGIVGENGSGKSTILKLIAGILTLNHCAGYPNAPTPLGYDEGWVILPKDAACAYLDQIPNYPEGYKVIDILNLAFRDTLDIEKEMHRLEEEMKNLEAYDLETALRKYSDLVQLFEVKGGYETQEKLNKVIKGLQFDESFLNKEFHLLSGGEKTTAVLGKLLIDNPDILLLDEPTNNLDMEAVEWLEGYLKTYKGTVIIVSHDRYFLDHVVTKIIEIEDKESITYRGNYTDYVRTKEEDLRVQNNNYKDQQKKIDAMEKSVKELRDWATRADNNKFFQRATSIQIKLDKLDRIEKPVFEKQNMKLNFNTTKRSGNITMKAIGLSKSFEDKEIFKDAGLLVNYGERVALIGPNGSGKTTFLKILFGEEQADTGIAELGANVRAAYLPQRLTFQNEELTVLECFREDLFILEGKAREYLSKFMFFGQNVFKKVRHLSGGERIRLKLAQLLFEDVNLLILDEPTNHLDTASIETIEKALERFKGTIFFISHDRYFINKIGHRIIAIENHVFKSYDGNYDAYKEMKDELSSLKTKEAAVRKDKIVRYGESGTGGKSMSCTNRMESRLFDDNRKIRNQKDQTKIILKETQEKEKFDKYNEYKEADIVARIQRLENEIKELDTAMAEEGLDYEELNRLYCRKEELIKKLDSDMELWLSLKN